MINEIVETVAELLAFFVHDREVEEFYISQDLL